MYDRRDRATIGAAVGAVLGALASFLFRPGTVDLVWWYTEAWHEGYRGTIVVCTVIGIVVGIVAAYTLSALTNQE